MDDYENKTLLELQQIARDKYNEDLSQYDDIMLIIDWLRQKDIMSIPDVPSTTPTIPSVPFMGSLTSIPALQPIVPPYTIPTLQPQPVTVNYLNDDNTMTRLYGKQQLPWDSDMSTLSNVRNQKDTQPINPQATFQNRQLHPNYNRPQFIGNLPTVNVPKLQTSIVPPVIIPKQQNVGSSSIVPTVSPSIVSSSSIVPTVSPNIVSSSSIVPTVSPSRVPTVSPSIVSSSSIVPTVSPSRVPTVSPSIVSSPSRVPTVSSNIVSSPVSISVPPLLSVTTQVTSPSKVQLPHIPKPTVKLSNIPPFNPVPKTPTTSTIPPFNPVPKTSTVTPTTSTIPVTVPTSRTNVPVSVPKSTIIPPYNPVTVPKSKVAIEPVKLNIPKPTVKLSNIPPFNPGPKTPRVVPTTSAIPPFNPVPKTPTTSTIPPFNPVPKTSTTSTIPPFNPVPKTSTTSTIPPFNPVPKTPTTSTIPPFNPVPKTSTTSTIPPFNPVPKTSTVTPTTSTIPVTVPTSRTNVPVSVPKSKVAIEPVKLNISKPTNSPVVSPGVKEKQLPPAALPLSGVSPLQLQPSASQLNIPTRLNIMPAASPLIGTGDGNLRTVKNTTLTPKIPNLDSAVVKPISTYKSGTITSVKMPNFNTRVESVVSPKPVVEDMPEPLVSAVKETTNERMAILSEIDPELLVAERSGKNKPGYSLAVIQAFAKRLGLTVSGKRKQDLINSIQEIRRDAGLT